MLEDVKRFFGSLLDGSKDQDHFDDNDYRVAAAALLVHVAHLDGNLSQAERVTLAGLIKARFDLSDERAESLVAAAEAADREAVDLYRFTSLLMRTLDEAGRQRIIEMMWEMALSDGAVSEFEDNVLWRVADLLGISGPQRLALRQRVADARLGVGEG